MYSLFNTNQAKRDRSIPFAFRGLLILMGILTAFFSSGQDEMKITTTVIPSYPTKIYQITDQPNKVSVMIMNNTVSTQYFYLRGSLNMESGSRIFTDPSKKGPKITIGPNQSMKLTPDNVQKAFNEDDLIWQGINKDDVIKNGLPEDDYWLCFTAYDYATSKALSSEDQGGCSSPWAVMWIDPPDVIQPIDDDMVDVTSPQNLIFSWTRPPGAPAKTQFNLKIVDVMPPDRNPNDAFKSASYPVFYEKTLNTTSYLYGPADPQFEPGHKYGVQVTVIDPEKKVTFRNNGMSEVSSFTWGQEQISSSKAITCSATAVNNQTDFFVCKGGTLTIPAPIWAQTDCDYEFMTQQRFYYRWYVSPYPPVNADWIRLYYPAINIPPFTENTATPGGPNYVFDINTPGIYYINFACKFGWGCCIPPPITYKVTVYPSMDNMEILSMSPLCDPCVNPSCPQVTEICSDEQARLFVPGLPCSGPDGMVNWFFKDISQNGTYILPPISCGSGNGVNANSIYNNTYCGTTDNFFIRRYSAQPPASFQNVCPGAYKDLTVWCHTIAGSITPSSNTHNIQSFGNVLKICSAPGYDIELNLKLSGQKGDIFEWQRNPPFSTPPVCLNPVPCLNPPTNLTGCCCDEIFDKIESSTGQGTYTYTVRVRNGECEEKTVSIVIIVEDPFIPVLASNKYIVCPNEDATVSFDATNLPSGATIDWFYQVNCVGPWIPPPNSVQTSVNINYQNTNQIGDQGQWYIPPITNPGFSLPANTNSLCWMATVTSTICPSNSSAPLQINIRQAPGTPVVTPAQSRECCGTPVTLTSTTPVSATTGPLTYQWYFNDIYTPIPGANQPTYSFTCSQATQGDYFIVVSNPCTSVQSNTVNVICCCIDISIAGDCCSDGIHSMTLVATATSTCGNNITSYTWTGPNGYTANGSTITLNPPPAYLPDNLKCWEYTVTVTDNMGCSNSKTICILACP